MITFRNGSQMSRIKGLLTPGKIITVFDTETTGLTAEADRIIEFSAMTFGLDENRKLNKLVENQFYIKPPFEVSEQITELTGITNEFLADKPAEEDVVCAIRNIISGSDIICGHNSPFDIRFVNAMFGRNDIPEIDTEALDTLKMAKDIIVPGTTENYKLGTLLKALGLDEGIQFHSAIDDVFATSLLLEVLIGKYMAQTEDDATVIDPVVSGIKYWTKNGIERLYVDTDKGSIYIDCKSGYIGSKVVDMTRVDIDGFKEKVKAKLCAKDFDEVLAYRN